VTESSPTGGGRRLDVEEFARDTNFSLNMTDRAVDVIEDRISRLEELVAARWPRSMAVRRRLAREPRRLTRCTRGCSRSSAAAAPRRRATRSPPAGARRRRPSAPVSWRRSAPRKRAAAGTRRDGRRDRTASRGAGAATAG
jgi:hypothetical protein